MLDGRGTIEMSDYLGYDEYHYWECQTCGLKEYYEPRMKKHNPRKCRRESTGGN